MASIRLQVLADETRQEVQISGLVRGHGHREAASDLGKILLVPIGTLTIKRRRNDDLKGS